MSEKLIAQLLFLSSDNKKISKEGRNYQKALTKLVTIQILLTLGEHQIAKEMVTKGIKHAIKHNYSDIGFLLCTTYLLIMRGFPSQRENHRSNEIDKLSEIFYETMHAEYKVDQCNGIIIENLQKGGKYNINEINEAYNTLIQQEEKLARFSVIKKVRFYYTKAIIQIFNLQFEKAIMTCNTATENLKKSKINTIQIIHLLKTQCLIHLNKISAALESINEAQKSKAQKSHNEIQFSELFFFIFIRSGEFENAIEEYEKVLTNKLNFPSKILSESWRQHGLLLLLLFKLNKIPPSESLERIKPKLRLGKLMNEMPEFSKDKGGQNLAARILNVLILLTSKKFEAFEEALPPLQAYIGRYKRHYPEIFRCDLMVKMLAGIPKVHYDAERSAWRAREYLEKMLVPPEELPLKITEMEVIPYEKIWQFVVEFLETLKRRPYSSKFKS